MGGRGDRLSDKDAALWRHVTGDVRPLKRREKPETPAAEPAAAKPAAADAAAKRKTAKPVAPAGREVPPPPPAPPPLAHGAAPGVDRRTAANLKRGRLPIEARIDLHGLTQAEAHRALRAFISAQHGAGRRCVLVVTGKGTRSEGGGVLRAMVPRWLNEGDLRPLVLSFTYARPQDGGEGALYLLLKRRR